MRRGKIYGILLVSCVSIICLGSAPAVGADLPKTHLKIIGHNSPQLASKDELKFWNTTVPKASDGRITATVTPVDLAGISDDALLRLLKLGVMDVAGFDLSKMAGDDPHFAGCDIAGLAATPDAARKACNAYRDVIDQQMQKNWNAKLYAIGANPPQVLWCRDVITGIADLKGKKVRVFNNSLRDFMTKIGATPISMSFAEVVPALNNGVVDCAVTGSLTGNISGWGEVTKSVFMMPLGWSINVEAFNLESWSNLTPSVREFLIKERTTYEDELWNTVKTATGEADNCNTHKEPCTLGKLINMKVVQMSPEDEATYKKIVSTSSVGSWAKRCGRKCADQWEETVGKVLDIGLQTK
ncbi:MAG: hypothetical protein EPN31_16015 [Castellaniella sp.]|uniref:TRAP transporter substrate-binding protein n=1 Tax=Castellaniella sp. TaxID=1955812 RepID=UPI0012052891|nr:TRAP transporter substrate-binding protein [Castellaniella sp.]TAN25126.1 MAG: hypothetical protein EPN31_16015 [Castellaniella sp.]